MKKLLILLNVLLLFFIGYYLFQRYEDYKFYKSDEYIFESRVLEFSNEHFFNTFLRYPESNEELFNFIDNSDYLKEEFSQYKFSSKFLDYGISNKYIEDSLFVLYSLSYNKKDDWPNLISSLNTLSFVDFILNKPDILIYGSLPPSIICGKTSAKLIINNEGDKVINRELEKSINFQLRKTRIDYFIDSGETTGELKIAYLEFNLQTDNKIELKIHCYNNFEDEFKILLINSIKKIMIENKLKKVIFPLQIIV